MNALGWDSLRAVLLPCADPLLCANLSEIRKRSRAPVYLHRFEEPTLAGRAKVSRLDFGVGGGDWADVSIIPDEVAVSTRVTFAPVP